MAIFISYVKFLGCIPISPRLDPHKSQKQRTPKLEKVMNAGVQASLHDERHLRIFVFVCVLRRRDMCGKKLFGNFRGKIILQRLPYLFCGLGVVSPNLPATHGFLKSGEPYRSHQPDATDSQGNAKTISFEPRKKWILSIESGSVLYNG